NIANPAAVILAGVMMLDHLGEQNAAARIEWAVREVIREGKAVTRDLNHTNPVGTIQMTDAIIAKMQG
ncbi:MAG: putative isocitrate dehydrogenase, NAD-dependent, partial [Bacteroidetes bacterium]|nr:putative isocitrate dehydrogenase, NAD-dependent [Bacteroidota bacterium]